MALYPIRLLKDKNRHPFFPFNTLESVLVDGTNKTLADVLDDIYNKEEINTMFATELSKFTIYTSVSQLPVTARVGAVATVSSGGVDTMYIFYQDAWHILTQKGDKGDTGETGPQGPQGEPGRDGVIQYTAGKNIIIENNVISAIGGGGGGNVDDIQVNGTSIVSESVANILTNSAYSSSNKIATMSDLPTIPTNVSAFTNDAGYLTSHQDISGKENISNKTTSISSASTNTQYPSAKAVYDYIQALDAREVKY